MAHILSQLIKKKLPEWNEYVFSLPDVPELCSRLKVGLVECPAKPRGEYVIHAGHPIIVLREDLKPGERLWVAMHEIGHHLLHYPATHKFSRSTFSKADREANFFAALALMPTWLCHAMTPAEIAAEYDYAPELIEIRIEISKGWNV